jgi:7,8-dihydroneopterin aldolase/epimerase/oxygenase
MYISLKNINLYAHHGVHDFEKEHGTRFELDVEVSVPDGTGASDKLTDTLDYTRLYKTVVELSTTQKFNLIESWGDHLLKSILDRFELASAVSIKIRKPGVAIGGPIGTVEVEVSRFR